MNLSEAEKRAKRCCFTAHRPEKLFDVPEEVIREKIGKAINMAINNGFTTFICGMAQGVDLWAGEAVIQEKQCNSEIKLICATPFRGFEERWNTHWRNLYTEVAREADYRAAISLSYTRSCFQKRNEWMVSHSGLVIAAYNGESGGTRNTVRYANHCGVPVYNIFNVSTNI